MIPLFLLFSITERSKPVSFPIPQDQPLMPTWEPDQTHEFKGYLEAMAQVPGGDVAAARYRMQKEAGANPDVVLNRAFNWLNKNGNKK